MNRFGCTNCVFLNWICDDDDNKFVVGEYKNVKYKYTNSRHFSRRTYCQRLNYP